MSSVAAPVTVAVDHGQAPGSTENRRRGSDIAIPDALVRRVEPDPAAGVEAACEQVAAIRETGAFAGVHLVPVSKYRHVSARLETMPRTERGGSA